MVVLADELLESFFETDLTASWKLETIVEESPVKSSFFGRLTSALVTDENKVITITLSLNALTPCVGALESLSRRCGQAARDPNY